MGGEEGRSHRVYRGRNIESPEKNQLRGREESGWRWSVRAHPRNPVRGANNAPKKPTVGHP